MEKQLPRVSLEAQLRAESAPVETWAREAGSLLTAASPAQDSIASRKGWPFGPEVVLTESRRPHVRARCQDGKNPGLPLNKTRSVGAQACEQTVSPGVQVGAVLLQTMT